MDLMLAACWWCLAFYRRRGRQGFWGSRRLGDDCYKPAFGKTFEGIGSSNIYAYGGKLNLFLVYIAFLNLGPFTRRRPSRIIHTCFEEVKDCFLPFQIWIGWRMIFWSSLGEGRLFVCLHWFGGNIGNRRPGCWSKSLFASNNFNLWSLVHGM